MERRCCPGSGSSARACCSGCSSSSTAMSLTSRWRARSCAIRRPIRPSASSFPGCTAAATARSASWSSTWSASRSSRRAATRSPTSRSTPTPIAPPTAASTWGNTRRCAPGSTASPRSRATSRCRRERHAAGSAAREPLMHCELVIPGLFSAPAEARLPSLELLLARGRARSGESRPLERWLAEAFGLEDEPIAAGALTALAGNRDPGEERWVRADPVHLRLMRDRLILVPAAAFGLSREEAEALCETLNEHFAGRLDILPVQPQRWSARLQMELEVSASSPFDMAGRELQRPLAGDALLNEAQMVLHEHPVNEAREARGEPAVNSLWLWGAGRVPPKTQSRWQSVAADDPLAVGLARLAGARQRGRPASAAAWLERLPEDGRHLVVLDELRVDPEKAELLERGWFAPLLAALRAGRIGMLTVHVPDSPDGASFETIRGDLRRFWRRPKALGHYA